METLNRAFVFALGIFVLFCGDVFALSATAYYYESPTTGRIGPVVSWAGESNDTQSFRVKVISSGSETILKEGQFERWGKRYEIDEKVCPGFSCEILVEALDGAGNVIESSSCRPEKIRPVLPLVVIDTRPGGVVCPSYSTMRDSLEECSHKIPGKIRIISKNSKIEFAGKCNLKLRGNSSRLFPKRQFSLELYAENGDKVDLPIFGMRPDDDWTLNGDWLDRSLIRPYVAFRLFEKMAPERNFAPELRFVEFFLNGEYEGVYLLMEKIVRKRVKEVFPSFGKGKKGDRFILKNSQDRGDRRGLMVFPPEPPGWPFGFLGRNFYLEAVYPKLKDMSFLAEARILKFLSSATGQFQDSGDVNATATFNYFDKASFIDFSLFTDFVYDLDGYIASFYVIRPPGRKAFFSVWDFDRALGSMLMLLAGNKIECPSSWKSAPFVYRFPFFRKLLALPEIREEMFERWNDLRKGPFADSSLEQLVTNVLCEASEHGECLAREAAKRNFTRWPLDDPEYHSFTLLWDTDCPNFHPTFDEEVEALKDFLVERANFLDSGGWNVLFNEIDNGYFEHIEQSLTRSYCGPLGLCPMP